MAHHLIKLLDAADKAGNILQEISIVPYANPIGLSQSLLGTHIGRFSLDTGVNFNREYMDIAPLVAEKVETMLCFDPDENVRIIRQALLEALDSKVAGGTKGKVFKSYIHLLS